MPLFEQGDVTLYYEEHGSGFPVLLIAPGGMRSAVSFWSGTPWNLIEQLAPHYRVIAMDQRNAGSSVAPVTAKDGWQTYTDDQLALLDHLGVDRFHVAGMCIGGPYILGLVQSAPDRVASAVFFQSIGREDNRQAFYDMFDSWAEAAKDAHPEAGDADWAAFRESMYGGNETLFNVTEDFLAEMRTPSLVLAGNDLYHPASTSHLLAQRIPGATYVEHWKEPEHHAAAMAAVERFLAEHTPR
jgi:pimeloyl-ACP methyl ester carboxylesterase